jgi:hypothetical protein
MLHLVDCKEKTWKILETSLNFCDSAMQPSSWSSALGHPVGREFHHTRAALAHLSKDQ